MIVGSVMQAGRTEIWVVGRRYWYYLHPVPDGDLFRFGPWPTTVGFPGKDCSPHDPGWENNEDFHLLHPNWRQWVQNEPMILDKPDFIRQVMTLVNENKDFLIP